MNDTNLINKIQKLKKQKNAVVLAHCYQRIEIDEVADFVGDSLFLSRKAAETKADIIVFAGVYFMAETAKILSPNKKVLLPRLEAGCYMADMITTEDLRKFKSEHPNCSVVCYVNSSAEVKAESDICCTSANAVKIIQSLPDKKILFVPDRGLGAFAASQVPDKEIVLYSGFCPTHMRIRHKEIRSLKEQYPDAKVLIHPECHQSVIAMADYTGSTSGIINYVKQNEFKTYIIGTEIGVLERLQRDYPDREFILASEKAVCSNMKWIELHDIMHSLQTEQPEITVDKDISEKAFGCIDRMLKIV